MTSLPVRRSWCMNWCQCDGAGIDAKVEMVECGCGYFAGIST